MTEDKDKEINKICSNPNCRKIIPKGQTCTCNQDNQDWNVGTGDISYIPLPPLKKK